MSHFFFLSLVLGICIHDSAILRKGNPLAWQTAKPYLKSVRTSGVKQFISHYKRVKDIETPNFKWGDELEYGVFAYDSKLKTYDLCMRAPTVREALDSMEKDYKDLPSGCLWQEEYGSWMIEAVPRDPYGMYYILNMNRMSMKLSTNVIWISYVIFIIYYTSMFMYI